MFASKKRLQKTRDRQGNYIYERGGKKKEARRRPSGDLRTQLMSSVRNDVKNLPETDLAHLAGDIRRSYRLVGHQWLDYMKHLKDNYPYLFSLAIRMNPFDPEASPIVSQ